LAVGFCRLQNFLMAAVNDKESGTIPVAIITGGTRGIGLGIATALARKGYSLILGYNSNKEAASNAEKQLQDLHADCSVITIAGDVAEEKTHQAYFAAFDEQFPTGELRVVVHNAGQYIGITSSNEATAKSLDGGGARSHPLGKMQREDGSVAIELIDYYDKIYKRAFIFLLENAIPRLKDNKSSVIGISSPGCNSSQTPVLSYAFPGTGKSAMEFLIRNYALTLGKRHINVNCIIPGFTATDAWKHVSKIMGKGFDLEYAKQVCADKALMPTMIDPVDIGDLVYFLNTSGRMMTGLSIPFDGGLSLK